MAEMKTKRIVGYDMLRTLACVMVVVLHASAQYWSHLDPAGGEWAALHVWNVLTRSAVPLFFMLSGALFLNGSPPGRKLWTRSIPRLFAAYLLWSTLYAVDTMSLPGVLADPTALVGIIVKGHYHLWFLPAMIGVYLLLPALYAIAHYDGGRALRPFCIVFVVFGILSGTAAAFDGLIWWEMSIAFAKIAPELCGVCGYFLLGYALTQIDLSRLRRWMLLLIFTVSAGAAALAGILYSRHAGAPMPFLFGDYTLTTFAEAVILFLLFRTVKIPAESRTARIFAELSACTMGIYLLHPFVLEHLAACGFDTLILPAWAGVPVVSAAVAVLCLIASALLRRIPAVGKWIV